MPAPSSSLATLRPDLGASFMEFDLEQDRRGFIGTQVLPVFESGVQSGTFGYIPIEQLLESPATDRASGTPYQRATFTFTEGSFATKEHGHEGPVDQRNARIYASYFDAEKITAQREYDIVLRAMEMRIAALLFNATTYTGASLTTAVSNEWDDWTNATPIEDVEAAVLKVYANTGVWPNALVLNRKVFRNLRQCAEIRERISSSGAGSSELARNVTVDQIAQAFDLKHIFIAGSSKNTANKGQTAILSQIWSDEYAMVCRVAETGNIEEPCIGRTFHWGEDGSTIGGTIESYWDEHIRGDIIRVRNETQEKILYTQMGHLLSNITT